MQSGGGLSVECSSSRGSFSHRSCHAQCPCPVRIAAKLEKHSYFASPPASPAKAWQACGLQLFDTCSSEFWSTSSLRRRSTAEPGGPRCHRLKVLCMAVEGKHCAGDKSEVAGRNESVIYKLAVFLSGSGSNFQSLHGATKDNVINGQVDVVVSDKPGCKGCEYAREHGIPVLAYPKGKFAPDGISSSELVEKLRQYGVDYILLAGYLRLLPADLVHAYPRCILNIHPALLPAFGGKGFYGMKVHEGVIRSGARFSGPTIHFIDEKYDTGPILAQKIVPVLAHDTPQDLAARVLKEEHKLYVEAVAALCEDRIYWRNDGVPLIRTSSNENEYY